MSDTDNCPCREPRLCILCGLSEPCGLPPPNAEPGDAPICTMEPETYAELVERVRSDTAATLRARVRELEADTARLRSIHENHLCDAWLTECGEAGASWERFLEMVDGEVERDRQEGTPEFMAEMLAALERPGVRRVGGG